MTDLNKEDNPKTLELNEFKTKNENTLDLNKKKNNPINILFILAGIFYLLSSALCFITFGKVDGPSMNPTLYDGEITIQINNTWLSRDYKKGDIISFDSPIEEEDEFLIKRVIATEGDHIVIENGMIWVNDILLDESYIKDETAYQNKSIDLVIPDNELFVMGDNRLVSNDSRSFGTIKISSVKARLFWSRTTGLSL